MNSQEIIVCFSDIKALFLQKKKKIFLASLIFALSTALFLLSKPLLYEASSTFKEGQDSRSSQINFGEIFSFAGSSFLQPKAVQIFKSRALIKEVVEKLGLQIRSSSKNNQGSNFSKNLQGVLNKEIGEIDDFEFSNIIYNGPKPFNFFIKFLTLDTFEVFSGPNKILAKGKINQKVVLENLDFSITKLPKVLGLNQNLAFVVLPLDNAVEDFRGKLKISMMDKLISNGLLQLTFKDENPSIAVRSLNALMHEYQNYLKNQNMLLAKEQLQYLDKRQNEISEQFKNSLEEITSQLEKNVEKSSVLELNQEVGSLFSQRQELIREIFNLDLEINRLENVNKEQLLIDSTADKELYSLGKELSELQKEKDFLAIALQEKSLDFDDFALAEETIAKIQKEITDNKNLIDLIDTQNTAAILSSDFSKTAGLFLKDLENGDLTLKLDHLKKYLQENIELLSLKEKLIKKQNGVKESSEFDGLTLEQIKGLYIESNNKFDNETTHLHELKYILEEFSKPGFEVGGLALILNDPMSSKVIQTINDFVYKIKDEKNYSEKEKLRFQADIKFEKEFLVGHIKELIELCKLSISLLKEKSLIFQKALIKATNEQMLFLEKRADSYIAEKILNLKREKEVLSTKLQDVKKQMIHIPRTLSFEKQLEFRSDMAKHLMDNIAELLEAKTINFHLSNIESCPIDLATLPLSPKLPRIYFFSILAFILTLIFSFLFYFLKTLLSGFPASLDNLRSLKQNVAGSISFFCDGDKVEYLQNKDLHTLRNVFSDGFDSKICLLLSNLGPNYSYVLCNLLAKMNKRILLIDTCFKKQEEGGLLQYLDKKIKKLPLKRYEGYDFLSSGGATLFSPELIGSNNFSTFLSDLKNEYDNILLYSENSVLDPQAKILLRLSDRVIVSFEKEKIEDFRYLIDWSVSKEKSLWFVKIAK
ncbi:MAG: hypothetical protein HZB76_01100 [Chlamydiae bacterium]|nr:hypothetical protein [Chlamydiota bacterium]